MVRLEVFVSICNKEECFFLGQTCGKAGCMAASCPEDCNKNLNAIGERVKSKKKQLTMLQNASVVSVGRERE